MLIESETWKDGKMRQDEKYGPRRQVSFRIGPVCEDRLARAAALFNMNSSNYAKAVLYKDLGIFDEPPDRRRRTWLRQKKRIQQEEDVDDENLNLKNESMEGVSQV
jgi:site-specific DNA-adenine methylase